MDVKEQLSLFYSNYDEEGRLASRHGSVEFLTTLRYVERYLQPGMRILEIGAATGRYSHYFARQGYTVDAVELVEHNIGIFRANTLLDEPVSIMQGNAVDLHFLSDAHYDITLLLGPMYHLFTQQEKEAALQEALRVTKPGGFLCVAYCMADASILNYGFRKGNVFSLIEKGLLDPQTFSVKSAVEEIFELYNRSGIDALMEALPVVRMHFVGTDMYTKYIQDEIDAWDDDIFAQYLAWHFSICERPDMVGISHHTLDVLRRKN